jgi:hypothetical protein
METQLPYRDVTINTNPSERAQNRANSRDLALLIATCARGSANGRFHSIGEARRRFPPQAETTQALHRKLTALRNVHQDGERARPQKLRIQSRFFPLARKVGSGQHAPW